MSGGKAKDYADRLIARARELRESDAFEGARREDVAVSAAQAKAQARFDARTTRRVMVGFVVAALFVAAFSLLLPYYGFDLMGIHGVVYSPTDVIDCYVLWFRITVLPLFDSTLANQAGLMLVEFGETHGAAMYTLVMTRAAATGIIVLCGIMLATAGLLFQTAFRNPLAVPSSLGVADGVTLGCIIFTMMGNTAIENNPVLYLQLVYGLGALAVIVVLLLSRAMSGGARYNVLDMLLLGTVICQLLGGVNSFIQNFQMDQTTWAFFFDIQQAGNALREPLVCVMVVVVFAITVIPALFLRFKLNLIAFDNDDGRMMGVRAGLLRGLSLVLGSVMLLAAIASVGQVAMLSLAVPFLVRYMLPGDFRNQFMGNCVVGILVLLICVAVQHFATIGVVAAPVGTIVSVLIVPFFVWMVALGRGRW